MKRVVSLFGSLFLLAVVLQLTGLTAAQADPTFVSGDVFVGVGNGHVQWRHADGTLEQTLTTNAETGFTTGMAFDSSGKLYVTNFNANEVSKFNTDGTLASPATFGSGYDSNPESIVFGSSGHAFVGQAAGTKDVLEFDSAGGPVATYDPATETIGTDWIDLAADQCTLYYTSEGTSIKRFDVCENAQLDDFVTALPGSNAFALRIRPAGGGILVADREDILLLDGANGDILKHYDVEGEDDWFALNLDPDGTSFWSADFVTSNVYKFDIATGDVLQSFNTDTGTNTVFGLGVAGEITVAVPKADLAVEKHDSPDPVTSGGQVQYTVTATNNGPDDATGVEVSDTLPPGFTFVPSASSDNCSQAETGEVVCNIGPLAKDQTSTLFIVATAPTVTGTYTDTATVSGDQADPDSTNDTDTETTTVTAPSGTGSATTFCPSTGCTASTGATGPTGTDTSVFTLVVPGGGDAGVVTLTESPCTNCIGTQVTVVPPTGYNDPMNPLKLVLEYDKTIAGKSTKHTIYKDGVALANCPKGGPTKGACALKFFFEGNGDLQGQMLWLSEDPTIKIR